MADYDGLSPGQVLADASVAEFIKSLGLGIAEAQKALDDNSVQQIAEFIEPLEGLGGKTLLDLGLSPPFYHYQHADITCSLQLSLRVEKDFSLGLNINGSLNDNSTSSSNRNESESSTESGSSSRTSLREANVQIQSSSAGALVVGGQNFALSGASPQERIRNLQNAITSDPGTGVARVMYELEGSDLTITTDALPTEVQTTPKTVTFLGGGHDRAFVRVGELVGTTYRLDDAPSVINASTTGQADLAAQAEHVKTRIEAKGYEARVAAPDGVLARQTFETGRHDLGADQYPSLTNLAQAMREMNFPIEIEGFADTQLYSSNSDTQNRRLGNLRAGEVQRILLSNGAPANLITKKDSSGVDAARASGDVDGTDNQAFRKTDIKTPGRSVYWIIVKALPNGPNLNDVAPNKIGDNSTNNGFIFLYKPTPLALTGKKATIEGIDFPFRNTAIAGFAVDSAEAYAKNLADDINANNSANLQASAVANVVSVSRDGDSFQLTLLTTSNRNISLSSTEGITVTTEFTRTRSSSLTEQNTGNRAVAVGASLDVRYSRQFEMNVTGNSSISARLVSIPAPPEFLSTIKDFLDEGNG